MKLIFQACGEGRYTLLGWFTAEAAAKMEAVLTESGNEFISVPSERPTERPSEPVVNQ